MGEEKCDAEVKMRFDNTPWSSSPHFADLLCKECLAKSLNIHDEFNALKIFPMA